MIVNNFALLLVPTITTPHQLIFFQQQIFVLAQGERRRAPGGPAVVERRPRERDVEGIGRPGLRAQGDGRRVRGDVRRSVVGVNAGQLHSGIAIGGGLDLDVVGFSPTADEEGLRGWSC